MFLLKKDTTRKGRVEKKTLQLELDNDNEGEEYKVEAICNNAVYVKALESGQVPGLYYLIFWKSSLKEENTLELALTIQHLRRLVSIFQKKP